MMKKAFVVIGVIATFVGVIATIAYVTKDTDGEKEVAIEEE